jgi:hypothetical protein
MKNLFKIASVTLASLLLSSAAHAENAASPGFVGCAAMLTFGGSEANCVGLYSTSQHFALGVRATTGGIVKDEATAVLGVLSVRPLAGTYWIDVGAGLSRSYSYFHGKYRTGLGAELRMGNRWTLPFGMTVGMTYAGIQLFGDEYSNFLLIGPELGWRF